MAEANKQKKKISVGTWIVLALALILIVEAGMVGFHVIGSARAKSGIVLNQFEENLRTEGITLYGLGRNFVVDHDFLVRLMALSEQEINAVRLPIHVGGHITLDGDQVSLDGEWLRQTASLAEMIFQSEYQVILSLVLPEDMDITPEVYEALWIQMNDAFGHRPANELWYELQVRDYQQGGAWDSVRADIMNAMRAVNPEREIMLTLPEANPEAYLDTAGELCKEYHVHLAAFAQPDMDAAILERLGEITFQNDMTAILIEAEGAEAGYTQPMADANGFGYLLQGD